MALTSGSDGLDAIRRIVQDAPQYLNEGGWLLIEHGYDQAKAVRDLLVAQGFEQVSSRTDLNGIERCSGGTLKSGFISQVSI
jgi:release factor glutamine methyltransferase